MDNQHPTTRYRRGAPGQSLVEYALIASLIVMAFIIAFLLTGPAISDTFQRSIEGLIGTEEEVADLSEGQESFWLTVTWVATQTPEEVPFESLLDGVDDDPDIPIDSVTSTPVSPTPEPTITSTWEPTAVPEDIDHTLRFVDTADDLSFYRVSSEPYIGMQHWDAVYYDDYDDDNSTAFEPFSNPIGSAHNKRYIEPDTNVLIPEGEEIPEVGTTWFSAEFERVLLIPGTAGGPVDIPIGVRIGGHRDGVRVWISTENDPVSGAVAGQVGDANGANFQNCNETDRTAVIGNWNRDADAGLAPNQITPDSGCVMIRDWVNQSQGPERVSYRTLRSGADENTYTKYIIHVDYYNRDGGNARLTLDTVSPQSNPDDQGLNGEGVNCNWAQLQTERSNTRLNAWSDAVGLEGFPDNQLCHLELRGWVTLGDTDTFTLSGSPYLSFWHVWDLNANTTVRLEAANYTDTTDRNRPTAWTTIWSQAAGTKNYEWTYEIIDLSNPPQGGLTFAAGDNLTYRFVVENNGGGGGRKRWYVDDIEVGNMPLAETLKVVDPIPGDITDTHGVCRGTPETCESYWTLNTDGQLDEFVTTGRWELTSTRVVNGTSLEDDLAQNYSLEAGSGDGTDQRVYFVEFGKRIDVRDTQTNDGTQLTDFVGDPDWEGDIGMPSLVFRTSYEIMDHVSLELQYLDETVTPAEWRPLRTIVQTGTGGSASQPDMTKYEVSLAQRQVLDVNGDAILGQFEDYDLWWQQPIRVRFAMTVEDEAISTSNPGWTIDQMYVGRMELPGYLAYPFYDGGGDEGGEGGSPTITLDNWIFNGNFSLYTTQIDDLDVYDGSYAFGDSIAIADDGTGSDIEYSSGTNSYLRLQFPIDLNSDTPSNAKSQACVNSPQVECDTANQHPAAVEPVLTFWWRRDIAANDSFIVEMSTNAGADEPVALWRYTENYYSSLQYGRIDTIGEQMAWERVEIALDPFLPADDGSTTLEDDIVISFRLDARTVEPGTAGIGQGVYFDEIRIEDRVAIPEFALGSDDDEDGPSFIDTIDSSTYSEDERDNGQDDKSINERWYLGGDWAGVNFTESFPARSGVLTLHESPPRTVDPFDYDESNEDTYYYNEQTQNIIEFRRIFDLTGVENDSGEDNDPVLYWWQRLHTEDDTRLEVQISREITPPTPAETLVYGETEIYGWSPWYTVYRTDGDVDYDYGWVRRAINLADTEDVDSNNNLDFSDDRIRIRFVLDASAAADGETLDGWFLDDIQLTVEEQTVYPIPFQDSAENTLRWVTEGNWGLDVEKARSGSTLPAITGDGSWSAQYTNCSYRPAPGTPSVPAASVQDEAACTSALFNDLVNNTGNTYSAARANDNENKFYFTGTINGLAFDEDFNQNTPAGPAGAPTGFNWDRYYAARLTQNINVGTTESYTIYVIADDAVRLGINNYPAAGNPPQVPGTTFYNNIINQWRSQAPRVYTSTLRLPAGNYTLTMDYFQTQGGAQLGFGFGSASRSFSDSPMIVPGTERVPVQYLSNTSLILDGALDFRGATEPFLQYYTYFDLQDINSRAVFEVSTDGGFTWDSDPNRIKTVSSNNDWTTFTSDDLHHPRNNRDWRLVKYDMSYYNGSLLNIRFRMQVDATPEQVANKYNPSPANNRAADGWNVTDILVFDNTPSSPFPSIVWQSGNIYTETGESAPVEVVATGQQPLTYQWYQGPKPPDASIDPLTVGATALTGANSAIYLPPPDAVAAPTVTQYWVRVSNAVGAIDSDIIRYDIRDCVALNPGDCGIYRINVGGPDQVAVDGSLPNWAGDFLPPPASTVGQEPQINFDFALNNINAIQARTSAASEALFETYRQGSSMRWDLPIEDGSYVVRLYVAEPLQNATANDRIMKVIIDGQERGLSAWDIAADAGQNRTPLVYTIPNIELVGSNGLEIVIQQSIANSFQAIVSGIEVLPASSDAPTFLLQPTSQFVNDGASVELSSLAVGAGITYQWYYGTPGDVAGSTLIPGANNPNYTTPPLASADLPRTYWVRVTDVNTNFANSEGAILQECLETGPGACGFWTINVGGPEFTAPDGTVWLSENANNNTPNPPPWSVEDLGSGTECNAESNWDMTYGETNFGIDSNHTPAALFNCRRNRSGAEDWWDIPTGNGSFLVKLYWSDDNPGDGTALGRRADYYIEGVPVLENFNLYETIGRDDTPYVAQFTTTVTDGTLRVRSVRLGGNPQLSGIELIPIG